MYSKLFNAIFVHVPKTGGQSIEHVFVEKHGLTWRTRGPLLLRKNPQSGLRPRHLAHLYATEYCEHGHLAPDTFASCFRFATVRNPYDRALSEYRYRSQKRDLLLADFLRLVADSEVDRHLVPQTKFVTDPGGKLLVNQIIRFESLADEFDRIAAIVFGEHVQLPHVNKSPAGIASEDMNENMRRIIYRRYECDFDFLRYPSGRDYHYTGVTLSVGTPIASEYAKECARDS